MSRLSLRWRPWLRQLGEYAVALGLVAGAVHANRQAWLLFSAAAMVAGWAAIHDAPLNVVPAIGSSLHRAGLIAEALALVGAALWSGHLTDLAVSGPLSLAAMFLTQLGLPSARPVARRRPALASSRTATTSAPRIAGQWVGKTGTVVTHQAERALPAGARRAGRLAARLAQRRNSG